MSTSINRATISFVDAGSVADKAGIQAGDSILYVDGQVLHDVIDWRWLSYDDNLCLTIERIDGSVEEVELSRSLDEEWGIEFEDVLFDGTMLCKNRCTFCFMRMVPKGSRRSLVERDDDFRLSFTQGNFVTFTNLEQSHVDRIIEQHLSPLRFSLHTSNPALREQIIGPYAQRGLDVAEQLLEAGIELHAQIVLMPHVNDGDSLCETLDWAWEHPGIINVGIVPLGFTKHQHAFKHSFGNVQDAQEVLDLIQPYRERAYVERGTSWVYAADEFYRNAYPASVLEHVPDARSYDSFDLFEDGIGMIRAFADDWMGSRDVIDQLASVLRRVGKKIVWVCGCAQQEFTADLVARSSLDGYLVPLFVRNDYFGGNVDVTGLLCGCDIARALAELENKEEVAFAAVPKVVLNSSGVMLDDMQIEQVEQEAGLPIRVVCCQPSDCLPEMMYEIEHGDWCE